MSPQEQPAAAPPTADLVRRRRLGTGLLTAAGAYLGAAAAMSLVFASTPPPRLIDHLADFEQGLTLYRWGFVGASMLAPTLAAVLVLLVTAAQVPADSARRWLGTILLAAYVPFATLAYTTQYTVLPGLVEADPAMAALWYLHDAGSIPYALDLTGYAVLGLAVIVLASTLLGRSRLFGWVAASLVAMGVLSLAALAFHAAGFAMMASVSTAASALCTLPVMALAIVEGRRLRGTPTEIVERPPLKPPRESSTAAVS
jgi:hypothetical protein